jgi:hypothetical protein
MEQEGSLGPVSYVIVEFPGNKMTGEAFPILLDLVDRGVIRILDLKFLSKDSGGTTRTVELADLDHDGVFDFAAFEGVSSGVVDSGDIEDAGSAIEAGSSAALLIFENRWATPFVEALRRSEAQLVAAGYIPHETLAASLDAAEA